MAERYNIAGPRQVRLTEYESGTGEGIFAVRAETFDAWVSRHGDRYFVTWTEAVEGAHWSAGWWAPGEIRDGVARTSGKERNMWFELLGGTAGNFAWRSDSLSEIEVGLEAPSSRWSARRLDTFVRLAETVAINAHADLVGLERVVRVKASNAQEWVAFVFAARIRHLPYHIAVAGPCAPADAKRWLILPDERRERPVEALETFIRFVAGSPYDRAVEGSPWFDMDEVAPHLRVDSR